MKSIDNRVEVDQGKIIKDNSEYIDINHKNNKMNNQNFNGLKNIVFVLEKDKIAKNQLNHIVKDNMKFHASKNSGNFSSMNLFENKSNIGEKSNTLNNFYKSRVSNSREKIIYSSSSFFRMNKNNNNANYFKQINKKIKNKSVDILSEQPNKYLNSNKKQSSFNKFSESSKDNTENEVHMVNLISKENKEVNKLKYITPNFLNKLLKKEKGEIKNPFQDSFFYPVIDCFESKKEALSLKSKILEDPEKFKIKLNKTDKKKSIINHESKNNLDESLTKDNIIKEKFNFEKISRNKKDENSFKIIPENKSSGVQCAFDIKPVYSPTTNLIKEEVKRNSLRKSDILIKNPEIRENINTEKPEDVILEDEKNILFINIYDTRLKDGIDQIQKNNIDRKKTIYNKRKAKTPNYMKSTISEQNKLLNIKKEDSFKIKFLNFLNKKDNCYFKYKNHKEIFKNTKENFKKFFQIANYEEATQIKFGLESKKRSKNNMKSVPIKDFKEKNQKYISKQTPNSVKNYDLNYFKKLELRKHYSSFNSNQQDNKYLHINNNEDLLKVYFDKSINKYHESYKKNGFIDNCNTSNGFINLGELNFLEKNNQSKNINNPFNSSMKSKENESNVYVLSLNKSPNNKFDAKIDKVDKDKAFSIRNLDITVQKIEENKERKNNGKFLNPKDFPNPSIHKFNLKMEDNSKNKRFKILKEELNKDKEKVNFMVENFKESL